MYSLKDSGAVKFVNQLPYFRAVLRREHKLRFSFARNPDFRIPVNVPVGVAGDGYGLCPVFYIGNNPFYQYGRAEDRAVENRPDGSVGTFPHFL